jgi:hypothetical protein
MPAVPLLWFWFGLPKLAWPYHVVRTKRVTQRHRIDCKNFSDFEWWLCDERERKRSRAGVNDRSGGDLALVEGPKINQLGGVKPYWIGELLRVLVGCLRLLATVAFALCSPGTERDERHLRQNLWRKPASQVVGARTRRGCRHQRHRIQAHR